MGVAVVAVTLSILTMRAGSAEAVPGKHVEQTVSAANDYEVDATSGFVTSPCRSLIGPFTV